MVVRAAPLVIASSVRRAKSFRIGNRASCAEFEFAFYRGEVGSRLISLTINQLSPVSISAGLLFVHHGAVVDQPPARHCPCVQVVKSVQRLHPTVIRRPIPGCCLVSTSMWGRLPCATPQETRTLSLFAARGFPSIRPRRPVRLRCATRSKNIPADPTQRETTGLSSAQTLRPGRTGSDVQAADRPPPRGERKGAPR